MNHDNGPVNPEPDGWDEPEPEEPDEATLQGWYDRYAEITAPAEPKPTQVAPHDLDAEAALLGAMMAAPKACDIGATLSPDDFYRPAHGHIHEAIVALHTDGEGVDAITVADALGATLDDIGGPAVLTSMVAATPVTGNAARYAQIIRNCARRRRQIATAHQLIEAATEGRSTSDHVGVLEDLEGQRNANNAIRLGDTMYDYLDLLESRSDGTAPAGISTGLAELDVHTGGFRPGQLVTLTARPGGGKSDMGCQIAFNAAADGIPTLLVSIEMGLVELQDRWMAQASHIKHNRLRAGQIADTDWLRITDGVAQLGSLPLYVHDDPSATLATIRHQARRISGIGLVVVDYLQLMESVGKHENRQTEVAALSKGLKRLGRDLEVPVLALAQLNRGVEMRNDKRPILADLRESGAIEQDSDIVIGLYRDEMYNDNSPDAGLIEALILKHRAGPTGSVKLGYDPSTSTISDMPGLAA